MKVYFITYTAIMTLLIWIKVVSISSQLNSILEMLGE